MGEIMGYIRPHPHPIRGEKHRRLPPHRAPASAFRRLMKGQKKKKTAQVAHGQRLPVHRWRDRSNPSRRANDLAGTRSFTHSSAFPERLNSVNNRCVQTPSIRQTARWRRLDGASQPRPPANMTFVDQMRDGGFTKTKRF